MKWPTFLHSRKLLWILVALVGILFLELLAKEVLYLQALYRSYKLSASYYKIDSGFWGFKKNYEDSQNSTILQFDPIITDRYGRHYYHPSVTGHQYGFAADEPAARASHGTIRILCMGSSIVEMGFPDALQEILNERHPGRFEVINAGVPGISSQGLLMNYIALWSALSPDILVLDNNVDSVVRNALEPWGLEDAALDSDNVLDSVRDAFRPRTGLALFSLVRWNLKYNLNWLQRADTVDPQGLQSYRSLLMGLLAAAVGNGAQPILLTYQPSLSLDQKMLVQFSDEYVENAISYFQAMFYSHTVEGTLKVMEAHNRITRDVARRMELPLVDVVGLVPRVDSSYVDGTHYSETANRFIAEAVAEAVLSLPDPSAVPPCPLRSAREDFDVAVVGGGLAGLAAAAALPKSLRVVVLEKENRLGGRVYTQKPGDTVLEMGASHSWSDAGVTGFGVEASDQAELSGSMGVSLGGHIVWCDEPMECVRKMGLDSESLAQIEAFATKQITDPKELGEEAFRIVNALYKAEQPDDIATSDPLVRWKAFKRIAPIYNRLGNGRLVEAMVRSGTFSTSLSSEVMSIRIGQRGSVLTVRRNGAIEEITARRVVLATTAPAAANLLHSDQEGIRSTLEEVRYHSIIVATFAFQKVEPPPTFTQVVTPDLPSTALFRAPSPAPGRPVINVYFGSDTYFELAPKSDDEILEIARRALRESGAMSFRDEQIAVERVQRWEYGTVKRPLPAAQAKKSGPVSVAGQVFLAGDYLCPMGSVGMDCAVWSGRQAARAVMDSLSREAVEQEEEPIESE